MIDLSLSLSLLVLHFTCRYNTDNKIYIKDILFHNSKI